MDDKLGVRFNRSYPEIIRELSEAVACIPDSYAGFEMSGDEWNRLGREERLACIRTLSDDIFYGLGSIPVMRIGSGVIEYDSSRHVIKVASAPQVVHMIHLV